MVRTTYCKMYRYEYDPERWPMYMTTPNEELIGKLNKTIGGFFDTLKSPAIDLEAAPDDDTLVFEDGGFTAGIQRHYCSGTYLEDKSTKETAIEAYFRITGVPHGRSLKTVRIELKEFVYIQAASKTLYSTIRDKLEGTTGLVRYVNDNLGIILHASDVYVHDVTNNGLYTDEYNSAWEAYQNK